MLGALALVAGCGSDNMGTEEEARQVAEGYLSAIADRDVKKACTYVDPASVNPNGSCEDELETSLFFGAPSGAKVKRVDVLEGSATIYLEPKGSFILPYVDDEYRIDPTP